MPDQDTLRAMGRLAALEGFWICPEGAACIAALEQLKAQDWVGTNESVVILNTGIGLKYPDTAQPEPVGRLQPTDELPIA